MDIIQPDNWLYRIWKWALVLLSFYLCFVSTMICTFSAPASPPPYVIIIDVVLSVVFAFDICLSFFVTFMDKTTFAMVDDRKRIAAEAAKKAVLHVILIIPFELVAILVRSSSSLGYQICSLLALLRFFYSTRINTGFSELEENENISFTGVRIVKMMWVCCLICHYGGCVFYLMATFHKNYNDTWFSLIDPDFVNLGLMTKYVNSMYYAVISFTTVGYGDLHPIYIDEKVFSAVFLLVDFAMAAYVTTNIIYLVAPDIGPLGKYRALQVRLLSFCKRNSFSDDLCTELLADLKLEYQSHSQPSEEKGVLESLPPTVKRKSLIALSKSVVANNNMFQYFSYPIQCQLIQAMEPVSFPANTSVILRNEVAAFLYFVVKGSVNLIFSEDDEKLVKVDEVFGETCVYFNVPQVFSAITTERSDLLILDRVNLMSILQGCPYDTTRMIRKHIEDLTADINPGHTYMKQALSDFENNAKTVGRIDLPLTLLFAVEKEYNRLFDRLVEQYPNANERNGAGKTALHLAASRGDVWKVKKLLGIGADPNLKDLKGDVPLWDAMFNGHVNTAEALKRNGATLEGCQVGKYACDAASLGNLDLLQAIGREDSKFLSVPDSTGQTALYVAVVKENRPMINYLVEMAAQIPLPNISFC